MSGINICILGLYIISLVSGYQSEKCKGDSFWKLLAFGVGLFSFVFASCLWALTRLSG